MTPSLRIALQDLQLERIAVVYPGPHRYAMGERVEAVPLASLKDGLDGLFAGGAAQGSSRSEDA
jgi:hypothetical protein